MVLIVKFVLGLQPVFQRVSAVDCAMPLVDLVSAALDFVERAGVVVFAAVFGIAKGESRLECYAIYNLSDYCHIGPTFCAA
jgi:hypothetical protein